MHARSIEENIDRAVQAIGEATALLITAGAGIGVDSGLPDFRGTEGFWRAYPALAKLGMRFEQMANPKWFERSPDLAWAFYGHRLNLYRKTTPHAGFQQLLETAVGKPNGYFVFTSNVDGQFQKAGFDENRIVECHGSLHHFQCCQPCGQEIWDASDENISIDEVSFRALSPLPLCRRCKGMARPNVLMFGDGLWNSARTEEQEQKLQDWLNMVDSAKARLAVIEIGAGISIPTVRMLSEQVTTACDAILIRINPREPEVPSDHIGLALNAAEGIRKICTRLTENGRK
jgi:NAD-dependent SIR2 family protein deacetylase